MRPTIWLSMPWMMLPQFTAAPWPWTNACVMSLVIVSAMPLMAPVRSFRACC